MMKWKEDIFDNFVKLKRGYDLPKQNIVKGKFPVVASTNIKAFHNSYMVKPPCITTGRSGSLDKVQYIQQKCWPLNTTLYVRDFKGNYPRYVYYFLKILKLENFNSGAGVPTLNQNHLHKLKINIPPISIQKKVAAILSAYDDLIDNNNSRIAVLEKIVEEIYREWFIRLRFPGYKNIPIQKGLPKDWEIKNIYSLTDVKGGGTPSTNIQKYWNGNIKFYTPTDYPNQFFVLRTEKTITEDGLINSSTRIFPKHSILITARGTVGNVCLAGESMAMNQSCFCVIPKRNNDCFYVFLFIREMVKYIKQVANGATFDAITLNTFRDYKAVIPDDTVRDKFTTTVAPIFNKIENLLVQTLLLQRTRDFLLSRLFSGKLPVEYMNLQFPKSMEEVDA